MAIVASEPLSDESWQEIPNGQCVLIGSDLEAQLIDFGIGEPVSNSPATGNASIIQDKSHVTK